MHTTVMRMCYFLTQSLALFPFCSPSKTQAQEKKREKQIT